MLLFTSSYFFFNLLEPSVMKNEINLKISIVFFCISSSRLIARYGGILPKLTQFYKLYF
jgi:hypothetical protein